MSVSIFSGITSAAPVKTLLSAWTSVAVMAPEDEPDISQMPPEDMQMIPPRAAMRCRMGEKFSESISCEKASDARTISETEKSESIPGREPLIVSGFARDPA